MRTLIALLAFFGWGLLTPNSRLTAASFLVGLVVGVCIGSGIEEERHAGSHPARTP